MEKKQISFCLARYNARNAGFLLIIIEWGESGKAVLQVSIAVFRALSKNFSGSAAPLEKIGPYAIVIVHVVHNDISAFAVFLQSSFSYAYILF